MLEKLSDPAAWQTYLNHKLTGGHLSREDENALKEFIDTEAYLPVVSFIQAGGTFAPPKKSAISKMSSGKKRIVYTYSDAENWVLKLLTFLLQRKYDYLFADNLYSFRRSKGVVDAVTRLTRNPNIQNMWSYKIDISNYFNSIPVAQLLPILHEALCEDSKTYLFLKSLLENPLVEDHGVLLPEEKGIMAGTPISTFLANLYLSHMDHHFSNAGILYARYSDDIILFDEDPEALDNNVALLHRFLANANLSVNPAKEARSAPGELWSYLGICYRNGIVDVAPVSVEKLKAKMRRKSRALKRWQARKGTTGQQAAKAFIRVFNKKLFENPVEHELTWARWYFPLINTAESLQIIDAYAQSCIRYLATGKHTKSAYNFRYEDMKALGYRTLVNCYYSHKKQDQLPV